MPSKGLWYMINGRRCKVKCFKTPCFNLKQKVYVLISKVYYYFAKTRINKNYQLIISLVSNTWNVFYKIYYVYIFTYLLKWM